MNLLMKEAASPPSTACACPRPEKYRNTTYISAIRPGRRRVRALVAYLQTLN
jgi:hypothetical protein